VAGDTFSRVEVAGARGRTEGENGTGPLSVAGRANVELQQELPDGVQQAEWEAMQVQTTDGSSKVSYSPQFRRSIDRSIERRALNGLPANLKICIECRTVHTPSFAITTFA